MRKLIYTTLAFILFSGIAKAQFPVTATQWSVPPGGINYLISAGDTIKEGFNWFVTPFTVPNSSQLWGLADLNGDGKPDLVVTGTKTPRLIETGTTNNPYWMVYLNTGTGFNGTALNWPTPVAGPGDSIKFDLAGLTGFNPSSGNYAPYCNIIDMNGDGKPDLVLTSYIDSALTSNERQFDATTTPYWRVYLNTGATFADTAITWSTPVGGDTYDNNVSLLHKGFFIPTGYPINQNDQAWTLIDMDGDGKPDLVVTGYADSLNNLFEYQHASNPYWNVYLNTGTGFSGTAIQWATPVSAADYFSATDSVIFGFFYYMWNQAYQNLDFHQTWDLRDMNGDGKPDLVVTGTYSSTPFNHVVQFGMGSTPYWKVYLNTGSGFSTTATQWVTPVGGPIEISAGDTVHAGFWVDSSAVWDLMDMNGDGKPDLVVTNTGDTSNTRTVFSNNGNPYWQVYLNTGTGFNTTPANWGVPAGGSSHFSGQDSVVQGFYEVANQGRQYFNPVWAVTDMNGDGIPDLVLPAYYDTVPVTGNVVFGTPGNQYWNVYLSGNPSIVPDEPDPTTTCLLYPNPNNGSFTLRFNAAATRQIEIYDVLGRLIVQPTAIQTQQQFNLGYLLPGIYLLRYTQNNEAKSLKFVVDR